MKGLKSLLSNNRGLTLIELVVAVTISLVILIPIYNTLILGQKVQNKAFGQVDLQEKTQELLNQLIEGKGQGEARVAGLRQANQVAFNAGGLAFTIPNTVYSSVYKMLTFYTSGDKVFYKEEMIPVGTGPAVNASGGTPVLENVNSFTSVEQVYEGKKRYRITVRTEKTLPGGDTNEVTLSTEVRPRNLK